VAGSDGRTVDPARIERMAAQVVHRGPDSFGSHTLSGAAIGIRRLRIIDLATGDQPISNEDGTVWVVLNGEIYNFQELRERLEISGHRFHTKSDTEVIVHGYEQEGDAFVARLRGMFALALWDDRSRRLVLARDRLGKKPLLYSVIDGELVFGSEMSAILAARETPRDIDMGALGDFLAYGYVPTPATIFRAVRKLPPGHVLVWEGGRATTRSYWSLSYQPKSDRSIEAAVDELDARLSEAVRLRLIADVPVGALLSGGIDSSLVVAFMAKNSSNVKTYTVGFEDAAYNELAHARRVAARYGTDHHEFTVRPDAAAILPILVRHYGEPFADSSAIPTYYVSQLARRHVTVALNGDGGDESFAGYDRYRGMMLAHNIARLPLVREGGPLLVGAVRRVPGLSPMTAGRVERFLAATRSGDRERYASWIGPTRPSTWRALIAPDVVDAIQRQRSFAVERIFDEMAGLGLLDQLLATDVRTYLLDDLLVKMDIASMANSLETRSPFLDHEVMEFAARLPASYKLGPAGRQKHILKKLARRYVPHENIDRPKQGFNVPVGRWLRSDLREMASEALLGTRARDRGYLDQETVRRLWDQHQSGEADRTYPLWTILMLELWHREFVDVAHNGARCAESSLPGDLEAGSIH